MQTITVKQLAKLTGTQYDNLIKYYIPSDWKEQGVETQLTKAQCKQVLLQLTVHGNEKAHQLFVDNYKGSEFEIVQALIKKSNLSESEKTYCCSVTSTVENLTELRKVPKSHQGRLTRLFNRLLKCAHKDWEQIAYAALRLADVTEHLRQQNAKGPFVLDEDRLKRSLLESDLDDDDILMLEEDCDDFD